MTLALVGRVESSKVGRVGRVIISENIMVKQLQNDFVRIAKDLFMTDNIYLASIYRLTAVNFWESAKILSTTIELKNDGTPAKVTAMPFYFLVSHAVELLLKSALLKRGFKEGDLRKYDYRHNLDALLKQLQAQGVSVTPDT